MTKIITISIVAVAIYLMIGFIISTICVVFTYNSNRSSMTKNKNKQLLVACIGGVIMATFIWPYIIHNTNKQRSRV